MILGKDKCRAGFETGKNNQSTAAWYKATTASGLSQRLKWAISGWLQDRIKACRGREKNQDPLQDVVLHSN